MTRSRTASLALVMPASPFDVAHIDRTRGEERRAHPRLTPNDLDTPITARLKYGQAVTLVDVSAGGALVETTEALRPDAELVLEILEARTHDVKHVVSRVLRCHVADLKGGVRYRGACAFKRPLVHPALAVSPPLLQTAAGDFLKSEFALKTIVEGYLRRSSGSENAPGSRHTSALFDALERLRMAAERRADPIDRQLSHLLAAMIPALQRNDTADALVTHLEEQLRRHLPLLAIRTDRPRRASAPDRELITLNMWTDVEHEQPAVTAEFPMGFGLDAPQFRLLKAAAYLLGLAQQWPPATCEPALPREAPASATGQGAAGSQALPPGWQRVVARFVDEKLLRGYSNDFHPERAHLHVCPTVNCPAAERLLVPIARLKAVFFVRDLHGTPERVDHNVFDHAPRARKVEVTFRDGEVMVGSTMNYKPNGQGFLLQPADSRGNNVRVYVVTGAIRHLRFV